MAQVLFVLNLEKDLLKVAEDDILGRKLQDADLVVKERAPKKMYVMVKGKKRILVYAHWQDIKDAALMGTLTAVTGKGKESFSFEYNEAWLKSGFSQMIDPDLQMYSGCLLSKR